MSEVGGGEGWWLQTAASFALYPPGLLLDITNNNFSYVFCMSSFFLISAGLFMGGSFYALQKKEKQGGQAEAEAATSEAALEQALTAEGPGSEKRPCPEVMYVTSV